MSQQQEIKAAKERLERIVKEVRECLEKDHGLVGVSDASIKICLGIVGRDPQLSSIQSTAELYDRNHRIKLDERDWPGRRISSLEWYHDVPSGDASLAAQQFAARRWPSSSRLNSVSSSRRPLEPTSPSHPRKKTARNVSFSPQASANAAYASGNGDEENAENGTTATAATTGDEDNAWVIDYQASSSSGSESDDDVEGARPVTTGTAKAYQGPSANASESEDDEGKSDGDEWLQDEVESGDEENVENRKRPARRHAQTGTGLAFQRRHAGKGGYCEQWGCTRMLDSTAETSSASLATTNAGSTTTTTTTTTNAGSTTTTTTTTTNGGSEKYIPPRIDSLVDEMIQSGKSGYYSGLLVKHLRDLGLLVSNTNMSGDLEELLLAITGAIGKGDFKLHQTQNNGSHDPRAYRDCINFLGPWQIDDGGQLPGYCKVPTTAGEELHRDIKQMLHKLAEHYGCTGTLGKGPRLFMHHFHDIMESIKSVKRGFYMGHHPDQSGDDVVNSGPNKGQVDQHTVRMIAQNGPSYDLEFIAKLVWIVDGKETTHIVFKDRVRLASGHYAMGSPASGRQPIGFVVDKTDGLKKALVLYHAPLLPSADELEGHTVRSSLIFDFRFPTHQGQLAFLTSVDNGKMPAFLELTNSVPMLQANETLKSRVQQSMGHVESYHGGGTKCREEGCGRPVACLDIRNGGRELLASIKAGVSEVDKLSPRFVCGEHGRSLVASDVIHNLCNCGMASRLSNVNGTNILAWCPDCREYRCRGYLATDGSRLFVCDERTRDDVEQEQGVLLTAQNISDADCQCRICTATYKSRYKKNSTATEGMHVELWEMMENEELRTRLTYSGGARDGKLIGLVSAKKYLVRAALTLGNRFTKEVKRKKTLVGTLNSTYSTPSTLKTIPISREKCSQCREGNCMFAEQPVTSLETCNQYHAHGGLLTRSLRK